jgi:hypothetical protein
MLHCIKMREPLSYETSSSRHSLEKLWSDMDESKRRDSPGATSVLRSAPPLFRYSRRLKGIH